MSDEKKLTKHEIVLRDRTPKKADVPKEDRSGYVVKAEKFNKNLTYIDKKSNKEEKIPAIHRNLSMMGHHIVALKGVELSKREVSYFSDEAKKQFLEKVKKDKPSPAEKKAEKERLEAEAEAEAEAERIRLEQENNS